MTDPLMSWQDASRIAPNLSAILLIIDDFQLNSADERICYQQNQLKKHNTSKIIVNNRKISKSAHFSPYLVQNAQTINKDRSNHIRILCRIIVKHILKSINNTFRQLFFLLALLNVRFLHPKTQSQFRISQDFVNEIYHNQTKFIVCGSILVCLLALDEFHQRSKSYQQNLYYIKMNVRNLKEMFQQKGAIKPKIQTNEVPTTTPKPIIVNETPIHTIVEEKVIVSEPRNSVKNTVNKNFLQQLNKKLDNKNASNIPARSGGLSYLQPAQTIAEVKKSQNELKIEDIITGVDNKRVASESSKARYAINQSNPRGSEQKSIFEELSSVEGSHDTTSFLDLLKKTLKNMDIVTDEVEQVSKSHEPRKSRVVNKYEYAQEKLTREQKVKRINYVLNVIFREDEYEIVPSRKEKQNRNTGTFRATAEFKSPPLVQVQPQQSKKINSEILVQSTPPVVVSVNRNTVVPERVVPQTMKSVNNAFLDELSRKIQKKQTLIITNPQQNNSTVGGEKKQNEEGSKKVVQKIDDECLTPRQKKKQKKVQNFDDL